MNDSDSTHNWDAATYEKISGIVQLKWGQSLLEKKNWDGTEVIMDAGSGPGNLTMLLAGKVPRGRVYAVDSDPNMVQRAKANLSTFSNVQIINSNMHEANLPTQVDVVFSNAALHWVLDLQAAFSNFWKILKPNGELLIECGAHGNLEKLITVIFKVMQSSQFRGYFINWKQPWYFPKQDEVEQLLKKIGFRDIDVSLSQRTMTFPERQTFAVFARTVLLQPFLGVLPDAEKGHFLEIFLDKVAHSSLGWSLDSVRLNIFARK